MKNRDLIDLLKTLSPNGEISIEIVDCSTGNHIASTYDVGFTLTENRELKLQVAVETATNNV